MLFLCDKRKMKIARTPKKKLRTPGRKITARKKFSVTLETRQLYISSPLHSYVAYKGRVPLYDINLRYPFKFSREFLKIRIMILIFEMFMVIIINYRVPSA
jgi:hypothetical protein